MGIDDPEVRAQLYIAFKNRRIREIGEDEYQLRKRRYDEIIEMEWKAFERKAI